MDRLVEMVNAALGSVTTAAEGLLIPAAVFFALGLAVKRGALFSDMRRAGGETLVNLKIIAFNVVFVVPAITLASQTISGFVSTHGLALVDSESWSALPAVAVVCLAVVVGDFVGYWRHRLEHCRLLWPAHAVHHSDTEMTWLTLERFHPINRLTTFLIDSSALLLLGFPPYALVANNLVRHYYGYFIHADLPWTYGRLGAVFVSPAMHRWHHAADARFFNANYATVFSLWDRAFGTYRVPGPCTSPLGVTDRMAPTLFGQLGYALTPRAYRRSFRPRRKTVPAAG